jgi:U4/U6.U5 tri-snRNP-associated protein 2
MHPLSSSHSRRKNQKKQEGYEVDDPCLDPIRAVLAPRFDRSRIAALDSDKRWARSLDGEPFVPGIVGLNSLGGRTDFANAVLQSLARVGPLRDFFLEPRNYAHAASSALVCRFGDFLRRAWNDRAFRGHVSPHELMVAVERASGGRFSPGGGGGGGGGGKRGKGGAQQRSASTDAAAFLVWLVNALHVDLVVPPGPTAPRGAAAARIAAGARSIITACFQGEAEAGAAELKAGAEERRRRRRRRRQSSWCSRSTPRLPLSTRTPWSKTSSRRSRSPRSCPSTTAGR